jgi:hypothetical protein
LEMAMASSAVKPAAVSLGEIVILLLDGVLSRMRDSELCVLPGIILCMRSWPIDQQCFAFRFVVAAGYRLVHTVNAGKCVCWWMLKLVVLENFLEGVIGAKNGSSLKCHQKWGRGTAFTRWCVNYSLYSDDK